MKRIIIALIAMFGLTALDGALAADAALSSTNVLASGVAVPDQNAYRIRALDYMVMFLRNRVIEAYRESFRKYEYPKLSEFEKKGYDWYWSCSMTESSGIFTSNERKRVLKEHGDQALQLWNKGWQMAGNLHEKEWKAYEAEWQEACRMAKEQLTSPTTGRTVPPSAGASGGQ